jgi:hypothetical protein
MGGSVGAGGGVEEGVGRGVGNGVFLADGPPPHPNGKQAFLSAESGSMHAPLQGVGGGVELPGLGDGAGVLGSVGAGVGMGAAVGAVVES